MLGLFKGMLSQKNNKTSTDLKQRKEIIIKLKKPKKHKTTSATTFTAKLITLPPIGTSKPYHLITLPAGLVSKFSKTKKAKTTLPTTITTLNLNESLENELTVSAVSMSSLQPDEILNNVTNFSDPDLQKTQFINVAETLSSTTIYDNNTTTVLSTTENEDVNVNISVFSDDTVTKEADTTVISTSLEQTTAVQNLIMETGLETSLNTETSSEVIKTSQKMDKITNDLSNNFSQSKPNIGENEDDETTTIQSEYITDYPVKPSKPRHSTTTTKPVSSSSTIVFKTVKMTSRHNTHTFLEFINAPITLPLEGTSEVIHSISSVISSLAPADQTLLLDENTQDIDYSDDPVKVFRTEEEPSTTRSTTLKASSDAVDDSSTEIKMITVSTNSDKQSIETQPGISEQVSTETKLDIDSQSEATTIQQEDNAEQQSSTKENVSSDEFGVMETINLKKFLEETSEPIVKYSKNVTEMTITINTSSTTKENSETRITTTDTTEMSKIVPNAIDKFVNGTEIDEQTTFHETILSKLNTATTIYETNLISNETDIENDTASEQTNSDTEINTTETIEESTDTPTNTQRKISYETIQQNYANTGSESVTSSTNVLLDENLTTVTDFSQDVTTETTESPTTFVSVAETDANKNQLTNASEGSVVTLQSATENIEVETTVIQVQETRTQEITSISLLELTSKESTNTDIKSSESVLDQNTFVTNSSSALEKPTSLETSLSPSETPKADMTSETYITKIIEEVITLKANENYVNQSELSSSLEIKTSELNPITQLGISEINLHNNESYSLPTTKIINENNSPTNTKIINTSNDLFNVKTTLSNLEFQNKSITSNSLVTTSQFDNNTNSVNESFLTVTQTNTNILNTAVISEVNSLETMTAISQISKESVESNLSSTLKLFGPFVSTVITTNNLETFSTVQLKQENFNLSIINSVEYSKSSDPLNITDITFLTNIPLMNSSALTTVSDEAFASTLGVSDHSNSESLQSVFDAHTKQDVGISDVWTTAVSQTSANEQLQIIEESATQSLSTLLYLLIPELTSTDNADITSLGQIANTAEIGSDSSISSESVTNVNEQLTNLISDLEFTTQPAVMESYTILEAINATSNKESQINETKKPQHELENHTSASKLNDLIQLTNLETSESPSSSFIANFKFDFNENVKATTIISTNQITTDKSNTTKIFNNWPLISESTSLQSTVLSQSFNNITNSQYTSSTDAKELMLLLSSVATFNSDTQSVTNTKELSSSSDKLTITNLANDYSTIQTLFNNATVGNFKEGTNISQEIVKTTKKQEEILSTTNPFLSPHLEEPEEQMHHFIEHNDESTPCEPCNTTVNDSIYNSTLYEQNVNFSKTESIEFSSTAKNEDVSRLISKTTAEEKSDLSSSITTLEAVITNNLESFFTAQSKLEATDLSTINSIEYSQSSNQLKINDTTITQNIPLLSTHDLLKTVSEESSASIVKVSEYNTLESLQSVSSPDTTILTNDITDDARQSIVSEIQNNSIIEALSSIESNVEISPSVTTEIISTNINEAIIHKIVSADYEDKVNNLSVGHEDQIVSSTTEKLAEISQTLLLSVTNESTEDKQTTNFKTIITNQFTKLADMERITIDSEQEAIQKSSTYLYTISQLTSEAIPSSNLETASQNFIASTTLSKNYDLQTSYTSAGNITLPIIVPNVTASMTDQSQEVDNEEFEDVINPCAFRTMKYDDFNQITEYPPSTSSEASSKVGICSKNDEILNIPNSQSLSTQYQTSQLTYPSLKTQDEVKFQSQAVSKDEGHASQVLYQYTTQANHAQSEILDVEKIIPQATTENKYIEVSKGHTPSFSEIQIHSTESLKLISSNDSEESTCSITDFLTQNYCVCSIDNLLNDLKVKLSENIIYENYTCPTFKHIDIGIVLENNSIPQIVRREVFQKELDLLKREIISTQNIDRLLNEQFKLKKSEHEIFATPGMKLQIPCTFNKDAFENIVNHTWTFLDNIPLTEARIQDNDGSLIIENVTPQDGGNYTCSVMIKAGSSIDDQKYEHHVSIVSLPTYTVTAKVFYTSNEKCQSGDADIISLYFPNALGNLICGKRYKACKVNIKDSQCLSKYENYLALNLSVTVEPINTIMSNISTTNCDVNCKMMIYSRIVMFIIKNLEIVEKLPVFVKLAYRREKLIPLGRIANKTDMGLETEAPKLVVTCPPGFGYLKKTHICGACGHNTFSRGDGTYCISCPAGQYQPVAGAKSCLICATPLQDPYCLRVVYSNTHKFRLLIGVVASILILLIVLLICFQSRKREAVTEYSKYGKVEYFKKKKRSRNMDMEMQEGLPLLPNTERKRKKNKMIPPEPPPPDFLF